MNIETVKLKSGGYLVNGNAHVPAALGNMDYAAVLEWIALGNTPEPEFTNIELKEQEKQKLKEFTKSKIESGIFINIANEIRFYPTDLTSQANLAALVLRSTIDSSSAEPYKFWCSINDKWIRKAHTAQEIQYVGKYIIDYIISIQEQYEQDLNNL